MQCPHYTHHIKTNLGLVGNDTQKIFSSLNTSLFPNQSLSSVQILYFLQANKSQVSSTKNVSR